jgi:hypothetical protein
VHLVLTLGKVPGRDNFILDFGVSPDRDRISLYVDDADRLCLRILSEDGVPHIARVPLSAASVLYGVPVYVVFELGLAVDYSYLSIELNGHHFTDRRLDRLALSDTPFQHWVLGSDVAGQAHTQMAIYEEVIAAGTVTFAEKQDLRDLVFRKYGEAFSGSQTLPPALMFSGNQFLYTTDHPNFVVPGPTPG